MTLLWVLFGIFYIGCGILAYGVVKNLEKQFADWYGFKYNKFREVYCWFLALLGPFGFLASFMASDYQFNKVGLTFRMPRELCKSK